MTTSSISIHLHDRAISSVNFPTGDDGREAFVSIALGDNVSLMVRDVAAIEELRRKLTHALAFLKTQS